MEQMNMQHEDKSLACRIRGCAEVTQASRRDRVQGATWVCRIHRAVLTLTPNERAQLDVLGRQIAQGQLTIDAAGWLTQVAPKPPRPEIVGYDDDGFIRLRDMSSPHGQTIRAKVDTLIGDDPRLEKYRDEADDDGQH